MKAEIRSGKERLERGGGRGEIRSVVAGGYFYLVELAARTWGAWWRQQVMAADEDTGLC